MLANLTALVRSTDAWRRFEIARFHNAALARVRAELSSYRPHELAGDLGISTADIEPLAQEEARRRTELHIARHPHLRGAAGSLSADLGLAGA
ncbi:hypothetical protein [Geminicoccus roseus]|uniref:hypothetical protein n=1 Tax=Geminicoccus roseus TaxID=404900 RepID=UPI0004005476|nr:hypothetical protein [Geminicoccus roseus]